MVPMEIAHIVLPLIVAVNRSQALALCRIHLHATSPDISALLNEPQTSALNRSCPQCKRGTLHVVDRQLFDRTATSWAPPVDFDSS